MAALDNIASELLKSANEADLIYKRTRDQAQRDKAVRLRRIVENLRNITLGASDLNGLSDVAISSPTNAQVLSYNSTTLKWQNTTISTATPTLAQVTTAGNTTTNAISTGNITVSASNTASLTLLDTLQPYSWQIRNNGTSLLFVNNSGNNLFRINANGNVLIGTNTDAGYKLDVAGTARVQSSFTGAVLKIDGTGAATGFEINSQLDNDLRPSYIVFSRGGTQKYIVGHSYGRSGFFISNGNDTVTYLNINSAGNVLVGTTTDGNAKFVVAGSITAASAIARGVYFNNTLVAAANNDVLVGLDINPTFTNGAFTGVTNIDLRTKGTGFVIGSGVGYGAQWGYSNDGIVQVKTNGTSTEMWFRPNNSPASFNSAYWGKIVQANYSLGIYSGPYQSLILATGNAPANGATITFTGAIGVGVDALTIVGPSNYGRIALVTAGSSPITLNGGNILIGTTTDAGYKLDVNGTARVGNDFTIDNNRYLKAYRWTNAATSLPLQLESNSTYNVTGINFISFNNNLLNNTKSLFTFGLVSPITTQSSGSVDVANVINIVPEINFAFGTHTVRGIYYNPTLTSLTGTTHRAIETTSGDVIFNGGNVGIGTPTPTDKFHIVDNTNGNKFARISAGGTDASAAWVAQNDQVDNIVYRVFGSAVTGSQMGQALARSASLIANLGGTGKFLIGSFSGTDLIFGTSDQARMRLVDTTGNFLIGTMTDTGNKLTVSGNIDAQGYKVNNVLGYTGILNIPTNPPGQQNIDIQGGIVINIF